MEAKGHEEIARTAGIPCFLNVLRPGLANGQGGDDSQYLWLKDQERDLMAFYIGNWLTDVSQAIDPTSFYKVVDKLESLIQVIIKETEGLAFALAPSTIDKDAKGRITTNLLAQNMPKSWQDGIILALQKIRDKCGSLTIDESIRTALVNPNDLRKSGLFDCARVFFKLKGYFKFCHPIVESSYRFNPTTFFEIFDEVFGQYYPHEHLDRPEKLSPTGTYADSPMGSDNQVTLGLYGYLRDQKDYIATLLTKLEHGYFSNIANLAGKASLTTDERRLWDKNLARFGHAVHAVEDYFAHSTFIEHVALVKPDLFEIPEDQKSTFYRRLAKTDKPSSEISPKDFIYDERVVTGSFDMKDTIISLSHLTGWDEALYEEPEQPPKEGSWEAIYIKYLKDIGGLLPVQVDFEGLFKQFDKILDFHDDLVELTKNTRFKSENDLFKKYISLQQTVKEPVADLLIAADVPQYSQINKDVKDFIFQDTFLSDTSSQAGLTHNEKIKELFFELLLGARRTLAVVKTYKRTVKLIKLVIELSNIEVAVLLEEKNIREKIMEMAWEKAKNKLKNVKHIGPFLKPTEAGLALTRTGFYMLFERHRPGTHSLIAKDHHTDLGYKPALACAKAAHYYIVEKMLRHANQSNSNFVDWHKVLDFFMSHPNIDENGATRVILEFPTEFSNTTTIWDGYKVGENKSFNSIKSDLATYDPSMMNWDDVLKKAYPTVPLDNDNKVKDFASIFLKMLAATIQNQMEMTLPSGMILMLPYQYHVPTALNSYAGTAWFGEVINRGWEIFRGYDRTKPPHERVLPISEQFHVLGTITAVEASNRITGGALRHQALEDAYATLMLALYPGEFDETKFRAALKKRRFIQ